MNTTIMENLAVWIGVMTTSYIIMKVGYHIFDPQD